MPVFATVFPLSMYNGVFAEITVKNLLEHTAGGWGNSKNDPMFVTEPLLMSVDINGMELIQSTLENRPLDNLPGTEYSYSNFGYYVLGRVIEKISGMTYEDYVKTNILIPCEIDGMRIGKINSSDDEVYYFSVDDGRNPYFLTPLHMDAHGGWIANPIELLKILVRVDALSDITQSILKKETINTMITPSTINENYALGWRVNKSNNWWHMGGMPGTTAMIGRGNINFNWVILVNSQVPSSDVDRLFWNIYSSVQNWFEGIELYLN